MLTPFQTRRYGVAEILDVTDANFDQEIMQSDTPVLVDFEGAEYAAMLRMRLLRHDLFG